MAAHSLPQFAEHDFHRVLCVVAHPDDVEYAASAAVAAWTGRGIDVAYLILTRGGAGIEGSPPDQTAELRTREQVAAADAVGVSQVSFLDYVDGVLEYSVGLRRDITRVIRHYKPAGLAAIDALRDAGNRIPLLGR